MNFIIKKNLTDAEEQYLQTRFMQAALALNIPQKAATTIYDQVHYEYTDWSRHYHNLSHIWSLLNLSEQFAAELKEAALIDMSIWFHDVVYDSKSKDNEQQSAFFAEDLLRPYLSKEQLAFIGALIMSTAGHQPKMPENSDNLWFLDFDLAILAAEKKKYKAYSEAIREEYKSLFSFFVYNSGRKKVLKTFLGRKKLYFTDLFREQYEPIARENLAWELGGLKEGE